MVTGVKGIESFVQYSQKAFTAGFSIFLYVTHLSWVECRPRGIFNAPFKCQLQCANQTDATPSHHIQTKSQGLYSLIQ
jgi:hypothetical protein